MVLTVRRLRPALALALPLALAAAGAPARADGPPAAGAPAPSTAPSATPAPEPAPDELFHKAGLAYDAGDYRAAHDLYARAFAKKKTHEVAAMLAQTEMKLGKVCEADAHLTYAIATLPSGAVDERRARLLRAQAAVRKKTGTLRVDSVPAGAGVRVDFQAVAGSILPGPFCVPAGDRLVFIERPGFAVERRQITIDPGSELALTVELRPLRSQPPVQDGKRSPRVSPALVSRTVDAATPLLATVLAVGVGGLVAGSILLPLAQAKHDEGDRLARRIDDAGGGCTVPTDFAVECRRLLALRNTSASFANAGLASILTGAVLGTAAGGFLLFRPPTANTRPGGPKVTIGADPGGVQAVITGEF